MKSIGNKLFTGLVILLLGAVTYLSFFSDGLGQAPSLKIAMANQTTIALNKPMKPVLVNFWATSCPGCIEEMPHLAQMKKRLGDRFELIAISMSYDPKSQVNNFIKSHPYPFNFVLDTDGKIAKAFGNILLTPTSFLIAPNGTIVYQKIGELDFKAVEQRIKEMSPQF